jgi:beta-alanine--pyruvate transaminase
MTGPNLGAADDVALRDLTRHVMVDFTQMKTFSADPLIVSGSDGIHLVDVEGRRYIDGISGVFAVSLGHGNEEVIEAIARQLRRVAFSSPIMSTTDRTIELAATLRRLSGGRVEVVKQLTNGSESTETALKMARQYHRQNGEGTRYKVISFYNAYHGASMGALAATGWQHLRAPYEPLVPGFVHAQPPIPGVCRRCPPGAAACGADCAAAIRELIELEGRSTVAAVILEPVMLTAGVWAPSPEYFAALRHICDETGVLLIFDEMVTGFGRLGEWFAADLNGVWPDLMCVGKGLSGGYVPLSAVLLSERVAATFWGDASAGVQYQAGHTFSGNPVGAATGLAVVDYMERHDVLGHVRREAAGLRGAIEQIAASTSLPCAVRGRGFLYCLDFGPAGSDDPIGSAVQRAARSRGLLVRASPQRVMIAPPLITTAEEIARIAEILAESVAEVTHELETTGGLAIDVAFSL